MTKTSMEKSSTDLLDYEVSFVDWLDDGDEIASATSEISGGTAIIEQTQVTTSKVKVWISGGENGESNEVKVTATTTGGRIKTECFRLRIRDC